VEILEGEASMKKKLVFGLVMILALACVLVSCNSEVSAENGAGSAKTGSIAIGQDPSKAVGYSVAYSESVETLYWYYSATKADNGYTTGQTTGLVSVFSSSETDKTGLRGRTLNTSQGFSYGLWNLEFYGFKTEADSSNVGNAMFHGVKTNFLVQAPNNYADVDLEVDNASTKIEIGSITVSFDHAVSDSEFTLGVTDTDGATTPATLGTVTVPTNAYSFSTNGHTVTFTGLTYNAGNADIVGHHKMVFTLSQVLTGTGNVTIEAANYNLEFDVMVGTTTTINGSLTNNDQTGNIIINTANLSGRAALSVPTVNSTKVVPVTAASISVDENTGAGTATVSTNTTISNGDLKVVFPQGAKIAVDGTTTSIDKESVENRKSDARLGFEYVSNEASHNIEVAEGNEVAQYELTVNLAADNSVLTSVDVYYGKGVNVQSIYHKDVLMKTKTEWDAFNSGQDSTEYWEYNSETGILTMHILTASPFNIIVEKPVATITTNNYYSLHAAFAAAKSGDTINLEKTVDLDNSGYSMSKPLVLKQNNVTLDLKGNEIKNVPNFTLTMQGENITVKNGKITSGVNDDKTTKINSYVLVLNRCDGVVLDGLTLTGGISVGGSQDEWHRADNQWTNKPDITGTVGYAGTSTGVVIKNCDVTSGDFYAVCSQMDSQATIESGTYTANTANNCSSSRVIHGNFIGTDGPEGKIVVNDGFFNGGIESTNAVWVSLKGGYYTSAPVAGLLANGFEVVADTTYEGYGYKVKAEQPVVTRISSANVETSYYASKYTPSQENVTKEELALQAALNEAQSGDTIKLEVDLIVHQYNGNITILADDVTFDLNGHILDGMFESGVTTNNGPVNTVRLTDSVGSGKITTVMDGGDKLFTVIAWQSKIIINDGYYYNKDNGVILTQLQTTEDGAIGLEINGGTFEGDNSDVINGIMGTIVINGGTFKNTEGNENMRLLYVESGYHLTSTKIIVNNGSFIGGTLFAFGDNHFSHEDIEINGGSFTVNTIVDQEVPSTTTIVIKGGTFNVDPSAYVPYGFVATPNDTTNPTSWTVGSAQ